MNEKKMRYADVVSEAINMERAGSAKVPFQQCKLWEQGNQINLWTYWQGYQLKDIDTKGVDILLVGQDWGNPEKKDNIAICESIKRIQNGEPGVFYEPIISKTDQRLAWLFHAFGDNVDITRKDSGMRIFFTNYSLGYRAGKESGSMTKKVMRQDSDLFNKLVSAIKPRIIICLGQITYEMVVGKTTKGFSAQLRTGEPFKSFYGNTDILVYGVAHPGNLGLRNLGGSEAVMRAAWDKIAKDYYATWGK